MLPDNTRINRQDNGLPTIQISLQETGFVADKARAKPKAKPKGKPKAKPKAKPDKTEAERAKRAAKREADRALIAQVQNPNQVLTFQQWCLLNGFSIGTARRLIASGDGPIITQLSPRRIGVRLADHIRWQASRARGVA
jgi:hypothetical protein